METKTVTIKRPPLRVQVRASEIQIARPHLPHNVCISLAWDEDDRKRFARHAARKGR
jgi:hypothetical protein